jgi:cob(I)alamin adenosyltransferase
LTVTRVETFPFPDCMEAHPANSEATAINKGRVFIMEGKNTFIFRAMPVRINRVYTRTGDDGTTALIGGVRVPKHHPRVEAYGCLDELNTAIGLCRAALADARKIKAAEKREMDSRLKAIQNRIFDLGSVFSAPKGKGWEGMPLAGEEDTRALEKSMDFMQKSLKPLNSFVLPGGSWGNAWLHQCRVLCRRAERRATALAQIESVPPEGLRYLNRLSDWFFVAARFVAVRGGAREYLWEYGVKKG